RLRKRRVVVPSSYKLSEAGSTRPAREEVPFTVIVVKVGVREPLIAIVPSSFEIEPMFVPAARLRYSLEAPLPTRNLRAAGVVEVPVPPLATGRMPLTSAVRLALPAVSTPLVSDFTSPAERLVIVVEAESVVAPLTKSVPPRVVAPVPM